MYFQECLPPMVDPLSEMCIHRRVGYYYTEIKSCAPLGGKTGYGKSLMSQTPVYPEHTDDLYYKCTRYLTGRWECRNEKSLNVCRMCVVCLYFWICILYTQSVVLAFPESQAPPNSRGIRLRKMKGGGGHGPQSISKGETRKSFGKH